jgi:hypothetical protein
VLADLRAVVGYSSYFVCASAFGPRNCDHGLLEQAAFPLKTSSAWLATAIPAPPASTTAAAHPQHRRVDFDLKSYPVNSDDGSFFNNDGSDTSHPGAIAFGMPSLFHIP